MESTKLGIDSKKVTETSLADFSEIVYCKAEGSYTRIYTLNKSFLVTKVLKCFETLLPANGFIRIHKTYIVNTDFILCLKGYKRVVLKTDIELPVSRRRRSLIVKKLSRTHLLIKLKD